MNFLLCLLLDHLGPQTLNFPGHCLLPPLRITQLSVQFCHRILQQYFLSLGQPLLEISSQSQRLEIVLIRLAGNDFLKHVKNRFLLLFKLLTCINILKEVFGSTSSRFSSIIVLLREFEYLA